MWFSGSENLSDYCIYCIACSTVKKNEKNYISFIGRQSLLEDFFTFEITSF